MGVIFRAARVPPHPGHRSVQGPYDILFEPTLQLAAMVPLILYVPSFV